MARVCSQVAAGTRQPSRTSATTSQAYIYIHTREPPTASSFLFRIFSTPSLSLFSLFLFPRSHRTHSSRIFLYNTPKKRTTPVTAKFRTKFSQMPSGVVFSKNRTFFFLFFCLFFSVFLSLPSPIVEEREIVSFFRGDFEEAKSVNDLRDEIIIMYFFSLLFLNNKHRARAQ